MKRLFQKLTLQRKILYTVISLSIVTVLLIVLTITYTDYKQTFENKSDLSLQTSKALSLMSQTRKSLQYEFDIEKLYSLFSNIQKQVDAGFIYVIDRDGEVISHTNNRFREHVKDITPEYQALVFGGSYTMKDEVFGEKAVLGVSPVLIKDNQVIGAVVVGYLVKDIYKELLTQVIHVFKIGAIILGLGIIVSFILARNIRKDTFGMDPAEIALLYRDRDTILSSMGEGLIAIDNAGQVTLMNIVAKQMLHVESDYVGEHIDTLFGVMDNESTYIQGSRLLRYEVTLNNIPVIVRSVPLEDRNGYVITIIDKSEVKEVTNALTEVKKYSNDLRAQTHEFSNKLYVILGLIQLGEYKKVEKMIMEEVALNEYSNRIIFEQINDPNVQAILLGKISKASEKKVEFIVDENSSLGLVPAFIKTSQLTIVIGNLIDNAIDAVHASKGKTVTFFALDYGNDIIFEVSDDGEEIDEDSIERLFEQGFSTKHYENSGFGLLNVQKALKELGGSIETHSNKNETTFTVYIPKT